MASTSPPPYPYLESGVTANGSASLLLILPDESGYAIVGGGTHHVRGRVDPATVEPRLKPRVQDVVARLLAAGYLDREDGERFLDDLFALWPRRVAA